MVNAVPCSKYELEVRRFAGSFAWDIQSKYHEVWLAIDTDFNVPTAPTETVSWHSMLLHLLWERREILHVMEMVSFGKAQLSLQRHIHIVGEKCSTGYTSYLFEIMSKHDANAQVFVVVEQFFCTFFFCECLRRSPA